MMTSVAVLDSASLIVDASVDAFVDRLGGPTVVRVPGRDHTRVRVLSGSIHGNEPSGARALHRLLRDVVDGVVVPATDLCLVFGALDASLLAPRFTHRMRPGQRDLNRCFRGPFDDDNGQIARGILAAVLARPIEAAVDIHNTTGRNPDFVIAGVVDDARAGLASLFSERYLAWRLQLGTLSEVLDESGVGVTFECGQVHDPAADARAQDGARRFATIESLPVGGRPRQLLRDPVRVRLVAGSRVFFGDVDAGDGADLVLPADLDRFNFELLPAGTTLGRLADPSRRVIRVDGDDARDGVDVAGEVFVHAGDRLVTRVPLVPIMITTNAAVAASDCLMYAVRPGA